MRRRATKVGAFLFFFEIEKSAQIFGEKALIVTIFGLNFPFKM